ncbi:MAG: UGMP family protein, partial [Candidatus Lokiarchaeota archaeon]
LTGGVAANKRLQAMILYISKEHKAKFAVVPFKFTGDNGIMIAWTGVLRYKTEEQRDNLKIMIDPKERMDTLTVPWRE